MSTQKEKSESNQKKLIFNVSRIFQTLRHVLKELHIKVFLDIPIVRFHNGKIHLVRATLPNVEITRRSKSCRKGNC